MEENKENKYENEYSYEEDDFKEKKNNNNKKIIAIILFVILGIIILLFLLRGCMGGKKPVKFDKENTLLQAGKEYYANNSKSLPTAKGICEKVTLDELVSLGLLDKSKYKDCKNDGTYVKVCSLESKKLHYVPILMCDSLNSEKLYGSFKKGKEKDLKADESDIKFAYKVEYLDAEEASLGKEESYWYNEVPYKKYKTVRNIKYYSYRDKQYLWNIKSSLYYPNNKVNASEVKEFYVSSPAEGYVNKSNETANVVKWYKLLNHSTEKIYYMKNGAPDYSETRPAGYNYNEGGVVIRSRTRTFTKTNDGTKVSPNKYYRCTNPAKPGQIDVSFQTCDKSSNGYNVPAGEFYTCGTGGDKEVGINGYCASCTVGSSSPDKTSCGDYGQWVNSSTPCTGPAAVCQDLGRDRILYKWYKYNQEERSYFPSNSKTAAGEKTYYLTNPGDCYKDYDTFATGYKWYNNVDSITGNYYSVAPQAGATRTSTFKYTPWTPWNSTYVQSVAGVREVNTKNKLTVREIKDGTAEVWKEVNTEYTEDTNKIIESLKILGYDIKDFKDIIEIKDLRYNIELYYRNKEV
ncbi:MAG: hypothetical protein RSD00_00890 [Bacilli bacterium]